MRAGVGCRSHAWSCRRAARPRSSRFLLWFGIAQGQNRYWMQIGVEAMWVAASVIGLNLLLGYTGLLSLGHWAFFIVGGFVGAIWAVEDWGLNPWLGFPLAFVVGMVLGALLALTCCHLRGFYLTVVTIAFGLLVSSIACVFDSQFNGLSGRPVTKPLDTEFSFISSTNPNRYLVGLYWIGVGMLLAVPLHGVEPRAQPVGARVQGDP